MHLLSEFWLGLSPAQESPASPHTNNRTSSIRTSRIPVDSATYEFDHSMWDAALLVPWFGHGVFGWCLVGNLVGSVMVGCLRSWVSFRLWLCFGPKMI